MNQDYISYSPVFIYRKFSLQVVRSVISIEAANFRILSLT